VESVWLYVLLFAIGGLIGSFLNVCIHRLPRHVSVAWPSSHCPSCKSPIAPYDNVPVLSYLWLRGRCRRCQQRISLRYPAVELGNGIGYLVIVWHFGLTPAALVYAALFSALLVVTGIDLTHQIIPDVITLPGIIIGLVAASTVLPTGFWNGVTGTLLGGGLLWALAWLSPYLFGKEGMGGGDIKLMAMLGAFLGWKTTLLTIMVGAILGSVIGLGLIATKVIRRDDYVPFGPFLAFGAVVSLFFQHEIMTWYMGLLAAAR
jgi:leader peptidase (prepilin peptidase) / N-methyltransferase